MLEIFAEVSKTLSGVSVIVTGTVVIETDWSTGIVKDNVKVKVWVVPICLDDSKKKYIIIKDYVIKNKTFTRFYFKNEEFTKVKVTQYSSNISELNTKIYLEDNEIALCNEKMNQKEGILIKKGKLTKNEIYFLDTSFVSNNTENTFTIILEFEK